MTYVLIPAAGLGQRMGTTQRKQYLQLLGRPILAWTVEAFVNRSDVGGVVVAAPAKEEAEVAELLRDNGLRDKVKIVTGGQDRQASVFACLQAVPESCDTVLVHDAVRPLVAPWVIDAVLAGAKTGAVSAALPVKDTIKHVDDQGVVVKTLARETLWAMQTPQGFPRMLLLQAHQQHAEWRATDDCALVERLGEEVRVVPGNAENIKITTPADLPVAEALLARTQRKRSRAFPGIGVGYDVHQLVPDRKLILGGVEIPHAKGLLGHSDADVLLHAVMDALLGAAGLGDIGRHFPDTDPQYKGISSLRLLAKVAAKLSGENLNTLGIDAVVIAERPRLAPHVDAMCINIAQVLQVPAEAVNIKATTNEKMGFLGREEGIAAQVVARVDSR